jgi:IS605 OrfB family transposase
MTNENSSHSEKQSKLLVSESKRFENMLIKIGLTVIKLHPGIANLIRVTWKKCAILYQMIRRYKKIRDKIISMLEYPQKNNLTTLIDKLSLLKLRDQNTLHITLLQILLRELILKEKDCCQFWTPLYKTTSEKLLSPIEIDCQDLDSTLLTSLLQKEVEKSQSLMMKEIKVQNKNCQKIYYQLSTSTVVDKWEEENINHQKQILKSLKIKLKLNNKQQKIINDWINTSNYVYNKTIETINNGHKINFISLRDKLVTNKTKKYNPIYKLLSDINIPLYNEKKELKKELNKIKKKKNIDDYNSIKNLTELIEKIDIKVKNNNKVRRDGIKNIDFEHNDNINDWELKTPKDTRAGAVDDVVKAYDSAFTNFKKGNIKFFNMEYRKKDANNSSILISKQMFKIENNRIKLTKSYFDKEDLFIKIGNKTLKKNKNIVIENDARLVKQKNKFYLQVPISIKQQEFKKPINYCGIDPGIRTFMTCFGNNGCFEYKHNKILLDKLNKKIYYLKQMRSLIIHNKRISLNKLETKKINIINEVHWKTINSILSLNDVILYGDIKSHNIVGKSKNSKLNQDFNDLKFYSFKQRLLYKASFYNKMVVMVNEAYTTKTCSCCGTINNNVGSSEIFNCTKCNKSVGRDVNAAKNILLKGIIKHL